MRACDYIATKLAELGTEHVFGVPGGVVLDLLYAFDRAQGICPHLNYHEQSAGFAACGYAQAGGRLGVAYATRGPGFTNLLTPMADAYCDSLPTLFLTAHHAAPPLPGMRVTDDQELDTCGMARRIAKFTARIDTAEGFAAVFDKACRVALSGRKGPVFLDVSAAVLAAEVDAGGGPAGMDAEAGDVSRHVDGVLSAIRGARRPVVLVGDGVARGKAGDALRAWSDRAGVPFLSSRAGHDVLSGCRRYYGYIGTHGIRAANFILSKSDLVVVLGNRLNFPVDSQSFSPWARQVRFIRCEIDEGEFARPVPNCTNVHVDVNRLVAGLAAAGTAADRGEWLGVCDRLASELRDCDVDVAVSRIRELLEETPEDAVVVSDVGNNEFWLSHASFLAGRRHRTLYSKSLGVLGCSLGKSIGAHYATGGDVLCVVGDQGLQVNVQELQYIAQHRLPITVAVVDNRSSGMIRDIEARRFGKLVHVTGEDGYEAPPLDGLFRAFGIGRFRRIDVPCGLALTPGLPRGKPIQDMNPALPREIYDRLDAL